MNIPKNILSVKIKGELFAFNGNSVEQILRVPAITRMPLANKGIKGVASVSGQIVTVIDTSVIFIDEDELNKKDNSIIDSRILTIKCNGNNYGLLVDEVMGMDTVVEENYSLSNEDSKISAIYKKDDKIYQVINECLAISKLKLFDYKPVVIDKFDQKDFENQELLVSSNSRDTNRYLFLTLGDEDFAISLDIAREIIFVPKDITAMSESSENVIGMITLRNELIVAVDLRKMLGVDYSNNIGTKEQRFLILNYNGNSIALLVDSISEVKDIPSESVETLPGKFVDNKVESVYKSKDSIVSMVSKKYLINFLENYSVENSEEKEEEKDNIELEESKDMIEVAVFQIAKEEFALGIEDVQEIIRYTEVTHIPEAPEFVEGVINLRGIVIPIISLPERLGFTKIIDKKSKILVCVIDGERIGLFVDDVNEIM
ncbi:MAG: chemotaxis protein CheW, partial [Campylobacterota bacterium]|nr:chemotaxis protein CheW [Campylobacterota bacterium]